MLLGLLATGSAQATGRAPAAPELLPVVFVHGNSGSAQQWESQFQRFASQTWLADPVNAAKVAKYANLDGRSAAAPSGVVATIAICGEWNSLPDPTRADR